MTSLNHWRLLPLILTGILTLWAGLFAFRDAFAVDPNEVQTTKNIRDLINQGKPRSAIKALTPLIEQAKAQNNADQWIWGTVQRANLQASLTDQPLVESIRNLDQQLETAPKVFQPVLEAILAKSYHSYFQNNRWRFANRTAIDGDADNKDFTEWSLRRILDRIDNGYQAALAEREILNQPISKFEELLVAPKDESDDSSAVSTLLDVIAISALDFYNAGEQANSMAQDPIVIKAEDPVLGTINEFINWEINEKHFGEPAVRAIDLLQRMLAWHRDKNNIEALAYWDQERFQFAKNKVTLGSTDERLVAAGKRHLQRFAGNSIAARMASILAKYHREQNRLKTAHDLATQTLRDYPGTPGANACHNLIAQIEQVQYQLNIESIWGEKLPPLKVKSYRNLGELNFRLYSDDFRRFTSYNPRGDHELFDNRKRQQFLSREPLASWSASLDPTPDFQPKSAELDIREKLKRLPLGGYFLVACDEPSFTKGRIDVTPILRTNLMLVGVSTNRNNQNSRVIGGYVVKGVSGEPLAGVQVDLMMPTEGTGRQMSRKARTTTDSNGQYRFPRGVGQYETYRIVASLKNDRIISPRQSLYGNSPPPIDERSKAGVAYTDRAIYRPGQSLQVAGVVYRADTIKNDYGIVPGVPVKIQLRDANNQEVRSEVVQTNDYGSWSTRFELPAQGVTGRFSILVSSDGQTLTQASVRVEEYKRPTFKIELEPAEDDARLSELVTIRGSAKAYTGASLDDAIVRYRVIRRGRHAPWWFARCYWLPYRPIADQEILVGETKTDSVGNFNIIFDADPDPSVDPESEPTFTFEVIADVTDSAGETRSSKTQVPLRFNPIQSRINVDANATDDNSLSVQVNVSGMSSEQTETGTLVVYRHSPPAEVDRFEKQDSENYQPLSPTTWPKVEVMRKEATVESGQEPSFDLDLKAGDYSIEWQVIHDGETLSSAFATSTIWPTRESIPEFSFGLPLRVWLSNTSMEPGGKVDLRWSAGHDNAHVWVEATHRNQPLEINDETASGWNKGPDQSGLLTIPVNESMRGGIQVSVWCVHQQQLHQKVFNISVPWTNKNLKIKWERFVDKLSPGQPETWTAIIQRSPGLHEDNKLTPAAAHMIATLYDASLDAFVEHRFSSLTGVFRQNYGLVQRLSSTNQTLSLQSVQNNQRLNFLNERYMWPSFDPSLSPQYGRFARGMPMPMAAAMGAGMRGRSMNEANVDFMMAEAEVADAVSSPSEDFGEPGKLASGNKSDFNLDLDQVPLRENLTETAFFYPSIITEKDGTIKISFTPPEALTQWNFLAFAHDTELRSGQLSGVATTSLPLMIQPNLPRFVRMGDEIYLSARVTNTSPSKVVGQANLKLQHPFTEESVDALVANQDSRKDFELEAGRSTSLFWRLDVSDDSKLLDGLTYKIAASDGTVSDGQRGYLPVLSQRVLVSESISMPFRTIGKHDFELKGLLASDGDPGILHRSLTLRVVSNPSWYAILGLPYLMEYPHECSEQTFNRYYANLLARHIVISNPKIERVFNQWRKAGDLRSPLESNESLKSVSIAETPWVRAAQNESTSRAAVARLFEINTIDASLTSALNKLTQMQRDDGFWPWFTGGPQNRYLTLYIATGFARLKHLGLNPPTASLDRAIAALDNWMSSRFAKLKNRKDYQPSSLDALYLYMRTFEINRLPVPKQYRAAFDFYVAKCQTQRMKLGSLQSESHLALALHRLGKESSAKDIAEAVLERGIESEELGLHWNLNQTWWWYQAPIETQAVIIEMLDELPGFESNVIDAKAWLIKQQQTNRWATTKATADAIYAIILRGADELADASLTQASVGGKPVKAEGVQAGSGSYDKRWTEASIKPEMARVTVNHPRDGVAWASLHWQYMNDIANIEASGEDSLAVKKELFIRRGTPQGPRLYPIQGDGQAVVKVGDEIVTRVVITADRDYEFVHVRDHRGSGTEPVDVNSGYQYSGGMGYYQSTRDTATNFFIGRLPIGRHVMEYSVRVQLAGTYQTGMTHVQCMYAPEFESHSQSIELKVGGQQLEISTE